MGPQRISELMLAHWHSEGAELGSGVGSCEARVLDLVSACWWMGAVPDMVPKAAIGLLVSGLLYQDHVEKDQMRWEIYSVHLWKICFYFYNLHFLHYCIISVLTLPTFF